METPSEDILYSIVTTTIVILFLVIMVISLLQVSRHRRLKHTNELMAMTAAFENEMNATKHEVVEQVLNDVAMELHDNVGQTLTLAIMNLNRMPDGSAGQVSETREIVRQAIQDIREISHMLSGDYWKRFDLYDALSILQLRLERSNSVKTNFQITDHIARLKKDQEILILRVIQELVNNSLKHGKAGMVSLSITEDANMLLLSYSDNGVGVSPENGASGSGLGMTSIKTRMELCKATWKMGAKEENGFSFEAVIPIS